MMGKNRGVPIYKNGMADFFNCGSFSSHDLKEFLNVLVLIFRVAPLGTVS